MGFLGGPLGYEGVGPEYAVSRSYAAIDTSSANFDLHAAHCKRNLERCNLCGEMVAKTRAEEHYDDVHAPVSNFILSNPFAQS